MAILNEVSKEDLDDSETLGLRYIEGLKKAPFNSINVANPD